MKLYKVTDADGYSMHGGQHPYAECSAGPEFVESYRTQARALTAALQERSA